MVLLLFDWFCNVFTPLSTVCNGFHCFSMVLLWSSLIFNAFAIFSFLFQAYANHCATIGKSMKSNFFMGGVHPPGMYPPIEKLLFRDFPMVALWFPLFFQWFAMVLLLFQWFCNSFHDHPIIFAMILLVFHWFCIMFSLPFRWFAMAFIVFSMVFLWSFAIFNDFAMVSIALSRVCNGFLLLFQGFAMVSIAFSMVFAVVSIAHPIVFAMVLLLFHWFCNVFTPLSMVCNGFHCLLNGFTVLFFDFQ